MWEGRHRCLSGLSGRLRREHEVKIERQDTWVSVIVLSFEISFEISFLISKIGILGLRDVVQ
jgi:hypothetical protein